MYGARRREAEEVAADLKTKEKLAKQDAVQEVPKSHTGRRTRASGDRTWRWAWVPQEGGASRPRDPQQGGPGLYGGDSVVEGEKGGGKGRGSRGGGLGRQ